MKLIAKTYVAGLKYYNSSQIKEGPAQLEWEPTNRHDPLAIKVIQSGIHIGYVPRGVNRSVKPGDIAKIVPDLAVFGGKGMALVIEQPEFAIPRFLDDLVNQRADSASLLAGD